MKTLTLILVLVASSNLFGQNSQKMPPSSFFTEVRALLPNANGSYASNHDDVFYTIYKIVNQTFTEGVISINVIDRDKDESTWSYTVDWSKISSISIASVTCPKDKCKKTSALNIYGERSFVACVYFLEKDDEKMQAIIDKYLKKD